jgi:membrane fusion protein (multidrug efflux system)
MEASAPSTEVRTAEVVRASSRWTRGRSLLLVCVAIAAGVAIAIGGWHWWSTGRFIESTDDAYIGGDVTAVATKVAGFVDAVLVTDNQLVHAGELLVRLDDRDYRALLAQDEAAVAMREAAVANLAEEQQLQDATIEQARAAITSTSAESARAGADVKRYRDIIGSAVSRQVFDQAYATDRIGKAEEAKARAAVRAAEQQRKVVDAERRQAEAALDQARATLDIARLNLGHTEIRAPIDGYIGNRAVRPGIYAPIGMQLLAIVPSQGLWVDANFKESQLARIRAGLAASIRADVLPRERFQGHVESLSPATGAEFSLLPPENATGNFTKIVQRVPVRIRLDGDAGLLGKLRPGLSVTVAIDGRGEALSP